MKLTVTQNNLAKALVNVSRIINNRVSLPILNNILLRAENNRFILSSTNMDVAIIQNIGAKIDKEGVVVVPAKLITEFIANLPKTNVEIELIDGKLHVQAGSYRSTINTIDPEDFPEIPEIKKATKLTIQTDLLKQSIAQTAPICSIDVTRPILTGVYMYSFDEFIYFVATDVYRLAEKKIMKNNSEIKAIIPASTLQNVSQLISNDLKEIEILVNEEQISFNLEGIEVTSRLIAGKYIDYRSLIPTSTENQITVEKSEFVRIIKIAELFARESAGSITIKLNDIKKTVTINSVASELGENTSDLEADVVGDGEITLNAKFLLEALNSIESSKVIFMFSGKLTPSLLKGVDKSNYHHIIMPVKS